ncbi:ABC transporter ATP-binding protein [Patescibacteria group bacterium]|nr:ABC transporter ATP-binding protein [Patescibacteria group bacterium]
MIHVKNLCKKYSSFEALKDISFDVEKGEVVGFLGPNGAGKTTTMRILTGYLPMTSGKVEIDGLDVYEESLKVRSKIGYLPETTPLYMDMTVKEYVSYIAELKKISKEERKEQVKKAMNDCGVGHIKDKLIKTLSKGFKQRVGIAQALVGNPEVLILDEPTIGLDPNQIVEIRNLIKDLGKEKTVILSTHILQEVSATCNKVIIISEGKIVAIDSPENLTSRLSGGMRVDITVKGPESEIRTCLEGLDAIKEVKEAGQEGGIATLRVFAKEGQDPREVIASAVVRNGWGLKEMRREAVNLEEIFMKLTKDDKKS